MSDSWTYLIGLLKVRPRSVEEARGRLLQRRFDPQDVEATIRRACDEGLLDDRLFVKLWIADRLMHRPLSRRAIAGELEAKGVAAEVIEPMLEAAYPPEGERRVAVRLAAERLARLRDVESERRVRRTIDYLLRKGFSRYLAIDIVRGLEARKND